MPEAPGRPDPRIRWRHGTVPLAFLWLAFAMLLTLFVYGGAGTLVAAQKQGQDQRVYIAVLALLARQALLPQLVLTWALYLLAARLLPRLEAGRVNVAAGLASSALAVFPLVGFGTFVSWTPRGPGDVAGTWVLLAGAAWLALFLPRLQGHRLEPGVFKPRPDGTK